MVTKRSIYSKLRSLYDYLKDLGDLLPFVLFVILPYLFDQVNGYSVIICVVVSTIFIIFSSFCWLELRERYLLEVKHQKLKDIGDETHKFIFFNIIETVIGIKLSVIITLLYIINILTLNCLLIKWLNGDIIDHLFHFIHHSHDDKYSNETTTAAANTSSSHNGEHLNLTDTLDLIKFDFLESKFNINELLLNVFVYLVIFLIFLCKFNKKLHRLASQFNERERLNDGNTATTGNNLKIRNINRLTNQKSRFSSLMAVLFQVILFTTLFLIIYLSVSFNSMHLKVKCEKFFKNGFSMIFLGTSITISSFNSLLMSEITRLPKRRQKNTQAAVEKPMLYNSLMAKYVGFTVFILIFLALQDLFNPYRNNLCDSYLNSLLDSQSHAKEIIKKLLLTVMCVYITGYFYKQLQIAFDNGYALFYSLLKREPEQQQFNAITNLSTVEISSTRARSSCCKPTSSGQIDDKLKIYRKMKLLLMISFFIITALKLIFTSYLNLIHIWSATFLLMNLFIISIILLLHYFPYQIFIGLKSYMDKIINIEKPASVKKSNIYKVTTSLNQETSSIQQEEPQEDIDGAFFEYKIQLRDKILKNKEFKFGVNQPNMKSAYKILFAYLLFILFSVINSILLNYLIQNEPVKKYFNLATLLVLCTLLTVLFTCKLFLCLFISYQPKETLFITQLKKHKINLIPFLQLFLSYLNVFFLLKLSKLALSTLIIELILILFSIFIFVQIIRYFNINNFLFIETSVENVNQTTTLGDLEYNYSINAGLTSISLKVDASNNNNDVSMASNINLV